LPYIGLTDDGPVGKASSPGWSAYDQALASYGGGYEVLWSSLDDYDVWKVNVMGTFDSSIKAT
jgi:hypothetical protein